jgi:DNA-binding XRE family transcriptional regulator
MAEITASPRVRPLIRIKSVVYRTVPYLVCHRVLLCRDIREPPFLRTEAQMFRGIDLVALPEERGLSQTAVSMRAGISRSALAKIESGRSVPTIETLLKLANSLKLPLAKFPQSIGLLRR